MEEITNIVTNMVLQGSRISIIKDNWDYAGILGTTIAPIIAIVFSIYNNFQIKKIRVEDRQREEEQRERSELKYHYQEINKFIDEQLYFLDNMSNNEFTNMIIRLQNLFSKCGMISRNEQRDYIIYYIGTYIEVSYFLLSDLSVQNSEDLLKVKRFFLNSLKELDLPLINKELKFSKEKLQFFSDEMVNMCKTIQPSNIE